MEKLLKFIITSIVSKPEKVKVTSQEKDDLVVLQLETDPSDTGLVIGKQGKIIRTLRQVLNIKAKKENKRVFLELKETGS